MDPVPYEISEQDVDEVLGAYPATGGGTWTDEERADARDHVMKNVVALGETIRTAPEEDTQHARADASRAGLSAGSPGERSPARREMALAAIEDLLIRDGYIEADADERRAFPATPRRGGAED
jgi:hypothetical protein